MKVILTTIAIVIGICIFIPTKAQAPLPTQAEDPALQKPVEMPAQKTRKTYTVDPTPYKALLRQIATAKGLPEEKIIEIEVVIGGGDPTNKKCPNGESGWNPNAVGDGGDSLGIVQINQPAHPEITAEQAHDVVFALNFIVDEFLAGNEWKWTCWKAYFAVSKVYQG